MRFADAVLACRRFLHSQLRVLRLVGLEISPAHRFHVLLLMGQRFAHRKSQHSKEVPGMDDSECGNKPRYSWRLQIL